MSERALYHSRDMKRPRAHDEVTREEVRARIRELTRLAKTDALGCFEGALGLLGGLVAFAAERAGREGGEACEPSLPARDAIRLVGRLLSEDARRANHEIDRETAWFQLFELWLGDDGGVLDDFDRLLPKMAVLESDRRLLVRLATDELGDLPLVFPGKGEPDVRRVVIKAARARLESLIAALLARDGRHAYALAVGKARQRDTGDASALVAALLRSRDSGAAIATAQRALEDPREMNAARLHALIAEAAAPRRAGKALRRHLETSFLRHPSESAFQALRATVPAEQWPNVRAKLLGHLQKHQREPSLVFKLYWDEGLLVDADGLVVTQPVDPDLLAGAAIKLAAHSPVIAAGWLLVAAYRLADSHAKSRWSDVIQHLVLARDLTARGDPDGGFDRVLRTFRFRHAHSPELLDRLSEAGL
jgi:hypothetical protein